MMKIFWLQLYGWNKILTLVDENFSDWYLKKWSSILLLCWVCKYSQFYLLTCLHFSKLYRWANQLKHVMNITFHWRAKPIWGDYKFNENHLLVVKSSCYSTKYSKLYYLHTFWSLGCINDCIRYIIRTQRKRYVTYWKSCGQEFSLKTFV